MLSSKTKLWSTAGLIFIGIIIGVIFTSNFNWSTEGLASRDVKPIVLGATGEPSEALLQLQDTVPSFATVSKEILPTVVSISTSRIVNRSSQSDNYFGPPSAGLVWQGITFSRTTRATKAARIGLWCYCQQ